MLASILLRMYMHQQGRDPTCGRCCVVHGASLGIQAAPFGPVQQHSLGRREQQHAVWLAVLAIQKRICLHSIEQSYSCMTSRSIQMFVSSPLPGNKGVDAACSRHDALETLQSATP